MCGCLCVCVCDAYGYTLGVFMELSFGAGETAETRIIEYLRINVKLALLFHGFWRSQFCLACRGVEDSHDNIFLIG